MENAADALKIGFALLVFVIAITIVFVMISTVKTSADAVLYYADDTNYQEPAEYKSTNRIVHKSDIISTLYRYYKESISVTVILDSNKQYVFDRGNENMAGTILELNTEEQVENNLKEFIEDSHMLGGISKTREFVEEFTEVPTSGIYLNADDGSEIILAAGGKKTYVTYRFK